MAQNDVPIICRCGDVGLADARAEDGGEVGHGGRHHFLKHGQRDAKHNKLEMPFDFQDLHCTPDLVPEECRGRAEEDDPEEIKAKAHAKHSVGDHLLGSEGEQEDYAGKSELQGRDSDEYLD